MKKLWFSIAGLWLISVIYFLVYVNNPGLQNAVDASGGLSTLHSIMDIILLGGGFALIARLIYWMSHRQ